MDKIDVKISVEITIESQFKSIKLVGFDKNYSLPQSYKYSQSIGIVGQVLVGLI